MQDKQPGKTRQRAAILVGAQFLLLAGLVFTTRFRWSIPAALLFMISACLLGWAAWVMRKSRLRVSPIPAAQAILMTGGPYRVIRHPMYTSLLLGGAALLIMHFSMERLLILLLLATVLIVKLNFEERLLSEKFAGYREYMGRTSRIFPYVF